MKQTAQSLSDPYRSKSTDIDDWLESMRNGAADLKLFQGQIGQLRKLGVSEAIIKQITDQGAVVGSELAQQIIDGGSELAKSLNKANSDLEKVANDTAYVATVKSKATTAAGKAKASQVGPTVGPTASDFGGVSSAISYGRNSVDRGFMSSSGYAGTPGPSSSTVPTYQGGDVIQNLTTADPDLWLRKAQQAQRDSQIRYGLTVGV